MEETIFPDEAVASLMKQHVIESRQHTDSQKTLTDDQFTRNRKDQSEIGGVLTNPFFVMVDPSTGQKVGEFALSGSIASWEGKWVEWIQQMAKKKASH